MFFKGYYDGKKAVPAWVRKKQWIVLQVKGDRAVIDKSVDGENKMCIRDRARIHQRRCLGQCFGTA